MDNLPSLDTIGQRLKAAASSQLGGVTEAYSKSALIRRSYIILLDLCVLTLIIGAWVGLGTDGIENHALEGMVTYFAPIVFLAALVQLVVAAGMLIPQFTGALQKVPIA